jgi:hypothetical protein
MSQKMPIHMRDVMRKHSHIPREPLVDVVNGSCGGKCGTLQRVRSVIFGEIMGVEVLLQRRPHLGSRWWRWCKEDGVEINEAVRNTWTVTRRSR